MRFLAINALMTDQTNLLNFDRAGMRALFHEMGEKPFRADQMIKWIHQVGVTDFSLMTNLSRALRERLKQAYCIKTLESVTERISTDGTHKWLLRLADGNSIETVFIPETRRGTLCISSQVGCALDCKFCSTGKQGFSRNLSVAEIVGQVWFAVRRLADWAGNGETSQTRKAITNVVLMGMGEPLLNLQNVVSAMNLFMDDAAYGLSKYRVTLSTSGVIPAMKQLQAMSDVSLAVSLHAPNDALRNVLVPLNKKYPIYELMAVCKDYFKHSSKRVVTFEYVMLKEVNDSVECAHQLAALLRDIPCKLNLIPFNPFPFTEYVCSLPDQIKQFKTILQASGVHVTVRKTRGEDIDAACGQLVGKFDDRTQRNAKWLRRRADDLPIEFQEAG